MTMRPYVIEVLGTPEAGKTTTIKEVISSLKQKGFKVKYIQESAEILPAEFTKGSIEAHVWMRLHTAMLILHALVSDNEIILVDRGILDTLFWDSLFFKKGALSKSQLDSVDNFFSNLSLMPNFSIIFTTSPEEAIIRRGGEGRIVTETFIKNFNDELKSFCDKKILIPKLEIDTTNMSIESVSLQVENSILQNYYNNIE